MNGAPDVIAGCAIAVIIGGAMVESKEAVVMGVIVLFIAGVLAIADSGGRPRF